MIIVAGHVMVEPQEREAYLAGCVTIVDQARKAAGCLDCSIGADLVDPGRVNIFERWDSEATLQDFRQGGHDPGQRPEMLSVSVEEYVIDGARPAFGG